MRNLRERNKLAGLSWNEEILALKPEVIIFFNIIIFNARNLILPKSLFSS